MKKRVIGDCTLYLGMMEDTIGNIERVDHILTDPPYLYIKTHCFDKEFNEQFFFENARRLLPDDGFIALFGRGTSFYRWNTRLADMGFLFKEEIVWDKNYVTSSCGKLMRIHETVSIHTKKDGKLRRSKIPYLEHRQFFPESILNDIKRIKTAFGNTKIFDNVSEFIRTGKIVYEDTVNPKHNATQRPGLNRADRVVSCVNSMANGIIERSIIKQTNERLHLQHPTEKPVRLAERILALISDRGDTIYDPFMGSGSFGVACVKTGRKYIGSEMNPEYFEIACKRIKEITPVLEGY